MEKVYDEFNPKQTIHMKKRVDDAPPAAGRHEKFQFGANPMKMNAFEESLAKKEVADRKKARHDYIKGIQGRDGGCFPEENSQLYDSLV
jgi:hypothetical protein